MKSLLLGVFFSLLALGVNAQAKSYLNFGGVGTGLYASFEIPLATSISIAPQATTDWDFNHLVIAAKGNFYFDNLFGLSAPWDVYAGANVGWRIGNDNGANWGAQVGARWFWNDRWGINAEFGGGSGVTGGVGLTLNL